MDKNKIFAIATISGIAWASTTPATEPRGKIGWQDLDSNGDDVISFLEFQEREQFELGPMDIDEDGMLSLDEFIQSSENKSGSKNPSEELLEKLKILTTMKFEKMDTDFNEFIDIAELQDAKFDAMDRNGDGVLSKNELRPKRKYRRTKRGNTQGAKNRGNRKGKRESVRRVWGNRKRN